MYKDSSLKLKAVFEKYRCLKGICFNARERAKNGFHHTEDRQK